MDAPRFLVTSHTCDRTVSAFAIHSWARPDDRAAAAQASKRRAIERIHWPRPGRNVEPTSMKCRKPLRKGAKLVPTRCHRTAVLARAELVSLTNPGVAANWAVPRNAIFQPAAIAGS